MKPKVSVVITARNEYPVILGTMYSYYNELMHYKYPFEIIVVDNLSTDLTPDILEDKFRRWVRNKILKVIRYNDKPANVTVRNIGAQAATGDVVVLSDAHISVKTGTLDLLVKGWQAYGGLWHSAMHIWGDTSDIKCFGYSLKLEEKFWGNLSRKLADEAKAPDGSLRPFNVPMASHCALLAGREEYLDFGGYNEDFEVYGGGEPYLDLKYWLFGSKVWLEPRGLFRHAFGHVATWRKVNADKKANSSVMTRDGRVTRDLKKGDEHLHYSRGYSWTNENLHFNFLLAAYTIGGYEWLQTIYKNYWEVRKGNPRYIEDLKKIRQKVLKVGQKDRERIKRRAVMTLNQLVESEPWKNPSRVELKSVES